MQPCALYASSKSASQNLFAAAAALHVMTGKAEYRSAADKFYSQSNPFMYYNNWNNVVTQVCAHGSEGSN